MTTPKWIPYLRMNCLFADSVFRVWDNGRMESRLASSFNENEEDYQNIMQLVSEGKLTIAPAE